MMKNLKLCFFFLLSPLFLLPSLFFLPSPSQSAFASSPPKVTPRTYPADDWTNADIKNTLSALSKKNVSVNDGWLITVALGLKKLAFKSDSKDVVFHFDKLASFFQEQIFKQKKIPTANQGFDFTKIQGEAQKQFLQPFEAGTGDLVDGFSVTLSPILKKYGDLFLNSIRPSLLKAQVLDLFKIDVSYIPQYDINSIIKQKNLNNVLYKNLKPAGQSELEKFAFFTSSPIPNHATTVLDRAINKPWTPWLKVLQEHSSFGLTHITVNNAQVDVSSLVNSSKKEVSALSLEEVQTLKKLQPLGLQKLQAQVWVWIDPELDFYKPRIQSTLENFATSKITQIKINGTPYQVNLLLKNTNLQSIASRLPEDAKNQLLALVKAKITPQTFEDALLEVYFSTIKDNLNALRDNNIIQVKINGKTYSLTELSKPVNKNKTFYLLSATAKTELKILVQNGVTKTQLDTALTTILATGEIEATVSSTKKKTKNQGLVIGLSVAGGTLTLSALGGFLYWFFKVKK